MIIEVDCNNDTIHIDTPMAIVTSITNFKVKDPINVIKILEQIFNLIPHSEFHNIYLIKIDEDIRITIGEW